MIYYDYSEWTGWSEDDVREYAEEITTAHSLSDRQARYLTRRMLDEAGHHYEVPLFSYPRKMDQRSEEIFRELQNDDEKIQEHNRTMNQPYILRTPRPPKVEWDHVGRGLTRRSLRTNIKLSRHQWKEVRRVRRRIGRHPFSPLALRISRRIEEGLWRSNALPIEHSEWLIQLDESRPYEGMKWYADRINEAFVNAQAQAKLGNSEAAMWHAFRAGSLLTELELRTNHGDMFEKYEAVKLAQINSGRSSKRTPDELRREIYWQFRKQGFKRIEAGRMAGRKLGLSESSIRNAFPDGRYPPE